MLLARHWHAVGLLIGCTCLTVLEAAAGPRPSTGQAERPSLGWTVEPWTADERPFKSTRAAIDAAFRSGPASKVMKMYGARPADGKDGLTPTVQFRRAYTVYRAAALGDVAAGRQLPQVAYDLDHVRSPRSYEFARIRFLIMAHLFPAPQLRQVGERLVRREPKDYDAKYYLVQVLAPGLSPSDRREALGYCQDLLRLGPRRPSSYAILGFTHFRIWLVGKQRSEGDACVAAYRKYLELAGPRDSFRGRAERIIRTVNQG